jgi:hypothetical protein
MRSNSGRDESRDNLHDPTIRDRINAKAKSDKRPLVSHAKAPADHRTGRKD